MSKHSKFQIALEYALARSILASLGVLPRRAALAVGLGIGHLAFHLPGNLRRTGRRNLEIAFPDMPEKERRELLRGSFLSLGRLLGEFSQLPKATPERLRRLIEYDEVGLRHLREAEKKTNAV